MFHDQYPRGGEFVSPEELGRVLDLGANWLTAHAKYMAQGGVAIDELDGCPVVSVSPEALALIPKEMIDVCHLQPSYEAVIPKRILDIIAPSVSEVFGLSECLKLSYFVPCYIREEDGELTYRTPSLLVSIPKPEGGEVTEDCLIITRDDDDSATSDRLPTMREGGLGLILDLTRDIKIEEEAGETSDRLQEHMHAQSFAEQIGFAHITQEELDAIEKVFLGLIIHAKR